MILTPEKIQSIIEKTINQQFENYWIYLLLSVIITLMASFLFQYFKEKGKNLAIIEDLKKITSQVETIKQNYKIEFDEIQKKNDLIFNELKESKNRYNSKQFELYNELWSSLIDLKLSADNLWSDATAKNLKKFSTNLYNAKISIEKSSLLIKTNHYTKLMEIIENFEKYENGKTKLIQIRNKTLEEVQGLAFRSYISGIIDENEYLKQRYDNLLNELKEKFRDTIKV